MDTDLEPDFSVDKLCVDESAFGLRRPSPVTIDVSGTSQVKVTTVPSGFGNRLESEMVGAEAEGERALEWTD